jgi:hypothetical protein
MRLRIFSVLFAVDVSSNRQVANTALNTYKDSPYNINECDITFMFLLFVTIKSVLSDVTSIMDYNYCLYK